MVDQTRLEQMYVYENKTLQEIGDVFGVHPKTVGHWVKKLGFQRCYRDEEWLRLHYQEKKLSQAQMAELAHCAQGQISVYILRYGIEAPERDRTRKYAKDHDFFEVIDTEEKAYWLGFLMADGYVTGRKDRQDNYRVGILLSRRDEDHLAKFRDLVSPESPIVYGLNKSPSTQALSENCQLRINSSKMGKDLISHGVVERKSCHEQPPNIDPKLARHFIRGYFDGDGSVGIYDDPRCPNGYKQVQVTFIGTVALLEWIQGVLGVRATIAQQGKLNKFQLSGTQAVKALTIMYEGSKVYLDRKYQLFQESIV